MGKLDLSDGKMPVFLKNGQTTERDVLEQIGEPFGYRQQDNRSAMIYIGYEEQYVYFVLGDFRNEKAHRLDLVFEGGVLQKAQINREGWGFGAELDPYLIDLLVR